MIGADLMSCIRIVNACGENHLPVAGGINDQSYYFTNLKLALDAEVNAIQNEQTKRSHGR